MPENDQTDQIIRRLTTSSIQQELSKAASIFVDQYKLGRSEGSGGEVLSYAETRELLEELETGTRDKYFGNPSFRDAVYLSWLELSPDNADIDPAKLEDIYFGLNSDLQTACCDLVEDFEQLKFDDIRRQEVEELIKSKLASGQCGKALRVLRENRGLLPEKTFLNYCEIAWSRISRLDERFRDIWLRYQALCGITNIVFHLDRPAFVNEVDDDEYKLTELAFVTSTKEVLSRFGAGDLDILSDTESEELLAELNAAQGFKHFDSMSFRHYLLLAWQDLNEAIAPHELERAIDLWNTFNDSEKRVANDLVEDFGLLVSRPDVCNEVDRHLEVEDYLGAFEVVKTFCIDGRESCTNRAKIWHEVAKTFEDFRLHEIAEAFNRHLQSTTIPQPMNKAP